jgi:hypothetical protein
MLFFHLWESRYAIFVLAKKKGYAIFVSVQKSSSVNNFVCTIMSKLVVLIEEISLYPTFSKKNLHMSKAGLNFCLRLSGILVFSYLFPFLLFVPLWVGASFLKE